MSETESLLDFDDLEKVFKGTNFGDVINSSKEEKYKYVLKALTERLYGYHTGWTITQIMIELGLLTPKGHMVSKRGLKILREYRSLQLQQSSD